MPVEKVRRRREKEDIYQGKKIESSTDLLDLLEENQ